MGNSARTVDGCVCRLVTITLVCPWLAVVPDDAQAELEEIVVTTRKREENLQNVPISVTAFTADQIERARIRTLTDIAQLSPSLLFDTSFGPQDTRVTIRGLSNTRGRSNVAFLVDGIVGFGPVEGQPQDALGGKVDVECGVLCVAVAHKGCFLLG